MQYFRHILLGFLLIGGWIPQTVLSKTVTLVNSSGKSMEFNVDKNDHFLDVLDHIQLHFQREELVEENQWQVGEGEIAKEDISLQHPQLDFVISHAGITVRSKKNHWRDYSITPSKAEKKDIAYIITTLANDSLISIAGSKSSLKKAGERIDHLHPLQFLIVVFSDEELKAGIHAIRDRGGWTWSGFLDGITGSLNEEAERKNLMEFISDFTQKIKINSDLILFSLQQNKWNDFVNILIDKIPRETDPNRYNM